MFFVWGTYIRKRVLGRVADYCPNCREPRAFVLSEVRKVSHLYWIPLGRGSAVGDIIECTTCNMQWNAQRDRYQPAPGELQLSLEQLITQTHPGLIDQIEQRLTMEEQALDAQAHPAVRRQVLIEPFQLVDQLIAKRAAEGTHLDWASGLAGLAMLVLVVLGAILTAVHVDANTPVLLYAVLCWIGAAAALVVCVWRIRGDLRRYIRRKHLTTLCMTLSEFHPTRAELAEVLAMLRSQKLRVAKHIDLDELCDRIEVVGEGMPEDRRSESSAMMNRHRVGLRNI